MNDLQRVMIDNCINQIVKRVSRKRERGCYIEFKELEDILKDNLTRLIEQNSVFTESQIQRRISYHFRKADDDILAGLLRCLYG